MALPVTILAGAFFISPYFMVLLGLYLLLVAKIYLSNIDIGSDSHYDKFVYALYCVLAKFPETRGIIKYHYGQLKGKPEKIIEYKSSNSKQARQERKNTIKQNWQQDRAKYPSRPWLKDVSIFAIAWYRYGQHIDNMPDGIWKSISLKLYWFVFHVIEIITGISLPKSVDVGGGLRIYHFGNIFIHKNAKIGKNCVLRQGVTLGNRYNDDFAPTLENGVELGAYAQVLGNIRLGEKCKVGAMTVVLQDVPAGKTICGTAGKIIN
jgi:serine O-acetyltransferase